MLNKIEPLIIKNLNGFQWNRGLRIVKVVYNAEELFLYLANENTTNGKD